MHAPFDHSEQKDTDAAWKKDKCSSSKHPVEKKQHMSVHLSIRSSSPCETTSSSSSSMSAPRGHRRRAPSVDDVSPRCSAHHVRDPEPEHAFNRAMRLLENAQQRLHMHEIYIQEAVQRSLPLALSAFTEDWKREQRQTHQSQLRAIQACGEANMAAVQQTTSATVQQILEEHGVRQRVDEHVRTLVTDAFLQSCYDRARERWDAEAQTWHWMTMVNIVGVVGCIVYLVTQNV
jgi:hypothetical protein